MNIKLNNERGFDLEKLIDSRLLVQANSGGGKSWLLRRILEQSHGKVQQIVIDLEGEFGTLREKYDYILAGKGGDTPATPKTAALLARRLLEHNVSAIIDLYELHHHERKHFVKLFLEEMINAPKELWHPCLVVIDEAHIFAPEKGQSEAMDAVIDLATRGRKRGYCVVLATQRLSKLHKDAAAECNNKLIGRTGLDIDMKRAAEELGFTSKEDYLSLRALEPGEFYAFGPALSTEVTNLKIGEVKTTHPKAGARGLAKAATAPTPKIREILKKLGDIPKDADQEARTLADLKAEIAQLKRHRCPVIGDPKAVERALKEQEARFLQRERDLLNYSKKAADVMLDIAKRASGLSAFPITTVAPSQYHTPKVPAIRDVRPHPASAAAATAAAAEIQHDGPLTGPEQRVLDAIAWLESIGVTNPQKEAIAFIAEYSPTSSSFTNTCGALRTKGLISYPSGGIIAFTDEGRAAANTPEETPTTESLHRKVLSKLSGPERRFMEPILAAFPGAISNDELADRSGYSVTSSTFTNTRGRLRTLGLVEYPSPGQVRAKDFLFLQ